MQESTRSLACVMKKWQLVAACPTPFPSCLLCRALCESEPQAAVGLPPALPKLALTYQYHLAPPELAELSPRPATSQQQLLPLLPATCDGEAEAETGSGPPSVPHQATYRSLDEP